jgi:hypothetical protein
MEILLQILFAGFALLGMVLLVAFVVEFKENPAPHPNYRAGMKTAGLYRATPKRWSGRR